MSWGDAAAVWGHAAHDRHAMWYGGRWLAGVKGGPCKAVTLRRWADVAPSRRFGAGVGAWRAALVWLGYYGRRAFGRRLGLLRRQAD